MRRPTVLLCRCPPNGWSVYLVIGGQPQGTIEDVVFATAYSAAMRDAFQDDVDYVQTNRDLATALASLDEPTSEVVIFLPEGGHAGHEFWTSHFYVGDQSGERFHVGNLRRLVEEPNVPFRSNRSFVDEVQIRRDWRAVEFSPGAIERQEKESNSNTVTEAEIQRVANEKEAHVRQWGVSSPFFVELYGKLLPHEWDLVWRGWQETTLSALRVDECQAVAVDTSAMDPAGGDQSADNQPNWEAA